MVRIDADPCVFPFSLREKVREGRMRGNAPLTVNCPSQFAIPAPSPLTPILLPMGEGFNSTSSQ